ncbi:hypothetical protein [Eshraghiella crossota]|uniref:hypothetical protein n=1 Tax=Eshraghiella crossota TaxID=45851 RepID=UPI004028CF62
MVNEIMQLMENEAFFSWAVISNFVLLSIVAVIFIVTRIILYERRKVDENTTMEEMDAIAKEYVNRPYEISQMVFEIIICNTCIIVIMYVYYWLAKKLLFLEKYLGIIMLVLIIIAILLNDFLDEKLKQDMIKEEDKGNIRLISSCSIIMLFSFLKIYFKTAEYDEFLLCYIGLVLGRFIYFDSTLKEFIRCVKNLKSYFIPLIIAFLLTGIISEIGLHLEVITTNNLFISLMISHFAILFFIHLTKKMIYDFI